MGGKEEEEKEEKIILFCYFFCVVFLRHLIMLLTFKTRQNVLLTLASSICTHMSPLH